MRTLRTSAEFNIRTAAKQMDLWSQVRNKTLNDIQFLQSAPFQNLIISSRFDVSFPLLNKSSPVTFKSLVKQNSVYHLQQSLAAQPFPVKRKTRSASGILDRTLSVKSS